jgi:Reverse transcriptase (RNA-dependent DNA polymerase)
VTVSSELPTGANVLNGRFVVTIKDVGTEKEIYKARYVVQGHRDKEKTSMVHHNTTARQQSTRLLIGLAAIFGFRVCTHDVQQAYLQSAENLLRDVYLKPPAVLNLSSDTMLKLLRPLYGLCDAGDYWARTILDHLTKDLNLVQTVGDSGLFFQTMNRKLVALTASFVDDLLMAGTEDFHEQSLYTSQRFKSRDRDYDNVKFAGVNINKTSNGFEVHQHDYIQKLQPLSAESTFEDYRSLRAKLMWLINTRPDISCATSMASRTTKDLFATKPTEYIKELNRIVRHVKTINLPLLYPRLDLDTLKLVAYTDSSFSNNEDLSSQLGYIIFLSDSTGACQPLYYSSHKSKRVTRSVLGGEVMAFADGVDMAVMLKHDIERMLDRTIPIQVFTDSLSLFDVITRSTTTVEKRLMIDIAAAKEAYKEGTLDTIGFIRTRFNPADAFTKIGRCQALEDILTKGEIDHPIEQWVERAVQQPT